MIYPAASDLSAFHQPPHLQRHIYHNEQYPQKKTPPHRIGNHFSGINSEWNKKSLFLLPHSWKKREQVDIAVGIIDDYADDPPWHKLEEENPFLYPIVNNKEDSAHRHQRHHSRCCIYGQGGRGSTVSRSTLVPSQIVILSTSYRSSPYQSYLHCCPCVLSLAISIDFL